MSPLEQLEMDCTAAFHKRFPEEDQPLVFGDGCGDAPPLMLVGEAPGQQEALQGKPFVGKAGKNLDGFLQVLGLARRDLYITNAVKVRPAKRSAAGHIVNRPPTRSEIEFFHPWLWQEIALVRPKGLVTLGNVPLHAICPQAETIGACHGSWLWAQAHTPQRESLSLPLFALYHPASVIYRAALKEDYQRDLETLRDSLAEAVNQCQ